MSPARWLVALCVAIALLIGLSCAQQDEAFLDVPPIKLVSGETTEVFTPVSNQWCNYTEFVAPPGTAVVTVDYADGTGDAIISLSANVYPRSARSTSAGNSFTLSSDSASHWSICSDSIGCDLHQPQMYTHGATFYACIARYFTDPNQNISGIVTFTAVPVNGTFTNATETSVVVHYPTSTESEYHWTVYNITLDWNMTEISGVTPSSSHYIFIPRVSGSNWYSNGNSRSFPEPGTHLVYLRSDKSFVGAATFTITTEKGCPDGQHGYYCLPFNSTVDFGSRINGTLAPKTGAVFSFVTPSGSGSGLSVTFDMGASNPYSNNYHLYVSGRGQNSHGQIPPYSYGTYESISAEGNVTLLLEANREYFITLYNEWTYDAKDFNLTITVSCPACLNSGVCSATSAPYACTCTAGYGGDNCFGRILTIQDGFGQLTNVLNTDNIVFFELTAADYTGYLINVTTFDSTTKSSISMYGFGLGDAADQRILTFSSGSGTSAYSFFVPASSVISGHKYIGTVYNGGYASNPRTINVTVVDLQNAPQEPSQSGAPFIGASLSLLLLAVALATALAFF